MDHTRAKGLPANPDTRKPNVIGPGNRPELAVPSLDSARVAGGPTSPRHAPHSRALPNISRIPSALLAAHSFAIPPSSSGEGSDSDIGADTYSDSDPERYGPSAFSRLMREEFDEPGEASRPNAMEEIHRLIQNLPDIDVPPEDRALTPIEMSVKLMEHQKVALKWLKDQESNPDKKGGLLAGMWTLSMVKDLACCGSQARRRPLLGAGRLRAMASLQLLYGQDHFLAPC